MTNQTPQAPQTALETQPELTKCTLNLLGNLKIDDYVNLLKRAISDDECYMSKEIFDEMVRSMGDLTIKPVPLDIIELLFDLLSETVYPSANIDIHSYHLIALSLEKLIRGDTEKSKMMLKSLLALIDRQFTDLDEDKTDLINIAADLSRKI